MSKILIIRFSALGDIAMAIPVIYSFARKYPMHEISFLSRKSHLALFTNKPHNLHLIEADVENEHKGMCGLFRLYKSLKTYEFDYVADFHSVIRSHFLRLLFVLSGTKSTRIRKGRYEKWLLTRKFFKVKQPLASSTERYKQTLKMLQFDFDYQFETILKPTNEDITKLYQKVGQKKAMKWIGFAPFSKHEGKIYPLQLQEKIVSHFASDKRVQLFFFGGGLHEKKIIEQWVIKYPTTQSVVGKMSMNEELLLMSQLDIMYSMDSANMHLASLVDTPVVSIWGSTHPYAGFLGWNQSPDNVIQFELPCRPCSIFGQKPCYRQDYACMHGIKPEMVIEKMQSILKLI